MFAIHSSPALAAFHTAASLIGLALGPFVLRDLLASRQPARLAALYLAIMAAASLSAFFFPSRHIGVGHVSAAISVAAFVAAIAAWALRLAGARASAYAFAVTILLYCDVLIAVFMLFVRVPFLHQAGPAWVGGIQLLVLTIFVALGRRCVASFHPESGGGPSLVTVGHGGAHAGL